MCVIAGIMAWFEEAARRTKSPTAYLKLRG